MHGKETHDQSDEPRIEAKASTKTRWGNQKSRRIRLVVADLPRVSAFAPSRTSSPSRETSLQEALIFFIKPRRRAIAVGLSDITCRSGRPRGIF